MSNEIILPYKYTPRNYQLGAWNYFEGPEEGKRAACVWHRRAGKDLFGINLIATKIFERVGMYWHLLPTYRQGRAIVWNGFTKDGRKFLDHFPKEIIKEKNKTEMRLEFVNGSMYQVVGTDDVDSLVGTNPVGCIFSEYSLQDPGAWNYLRPILAENGGWALFIFTMRGKNHGYKLYQMAKTNKKWFAEILIAGDNGTKREDGTPVVSDQIIQEERDAGMPEEMIQQEFFCSAAAALVGAYYGKQMTAIEKKGQIGRVPWEPNLQVHTCWDLGIDDEMVVWFIQEGPGEIRVIDHVKHSGESLAHFIKILRGQVEGYERMGDYIYGKHYAPHDIEVRELSNGKSRKEMAKELGLKFTVVQRHEIEDGIEAVRSILPMCWFDEGRCERGIEAMKSYRKEWDDKNKTFKGNPEHDWSSHDADAFRTYAWGRKKHKIGGYGERQSHAHDNHDYTQT